MNYDKLSRALRYYYQKGIIKKVFILEISFIQIKALKGGIISSYESTRNSVEDFSLDINLRRTDPWKLKRWPSAKKDVSLFKRKLENLENKK